MVAYTHHKFAKTIALFIPHIVVHSCCFPIGPTSEASEVVQAIHPHAEASTRVKPPHRLPFQSTSNPSCIKQVGDVSRKIPIGTHVGRRKANQSTIVLFLTHLFCDSDRGNSGILLGPGHVAGSRLANGEELSRTSARISCRSAEEGRCVCAHGRDCKAAGPALHPPCACGGPVAARWRARWRRKEAPKRPPTSTPTTTSCAPRARQLGLPFFFAFAAAFGERRPALLHLGGRWRQPVQPDGR